MSTERRGIFAATPRGARDAGTWIQGFLDDAHPLDAFSCELAIMEAVNNVVEHSAYATSFSLVVRARPGRLGVAVCFRDVPFSPPVPQMPSAHAESGRGLAIIDHCMERVRFVHRDGETRVLMARHMRPGDNLSTPTCQVPPEEEQ